MDSITNRRHTALEQVENYILRKTRYNYEYQCREIRWEQTNRSVRSC